MMRHLSMGLVVAAFVTAGSAGDVRGADGLRAVLEPVIQPMIEKHWVVGVAVGVLCDRQREVHAFGRVALDSDRAPDGSTIYEIGSITKTFTSLLPAEMVSSGDVRLDDPVRLHLREGAKLPSRSGREITLEQLSTHSSALPRIPWQIRWNVFASNPYRQHTVDDLYRYLAWCPLDRDPGAQWEYSNLGAAVLGQALAHRAALTYDELLQHRIFKPLGMNSTCTRVPDGLEGRLAPGHDLPGGRTSNWEFDAYAPAGAIRSSVNDMLLYLSAQMGLVESPLTSAMRLSQEVRRPAFDNHGQALGWMVRRAGNGVPAVVWHNGCTGGYRSFAGFVPERRIGVVLLSNAQWADLDTAGFTLVDRLCRPTDSGPAKPAGQPQ